jgi:hypothetical protein
MAANAMQRKPGREQRVAVVEAHPPFVHPAHHGHHFLHFVRVCKYRLRHVPAGGVLHFLVLQVKSGFGKQGKIAYVVVMQVGDDHFAHLGSIHSQALQSEFR